MMHEKIYNTVRMICGSLLMVGMFMMPSCEDNRVEEEIVLEPKMEMWVNGTYFNAFEYYEQVNTYGEKTVGEDGKVKKLFVLHLQREVGRVLPELEHYAAIWYDKDGENNGQLIDPGLYLNYGPLDTLDREKSINLEIVGTQDYTEFAQAEIYEYNGNKISGFANGYFYNPYRDEMQIAVLLFENIVIGTDPEATFYTGDF
jgi:hypothetical protein